MSEYSILDKRKSPFVILHKAIPLAYAPYIGAEATSLYLLYASLADQGNASIEFDDVKDFLGINDESLEKCNKVLEEYGLIKLENHEHNGKIIVNCYVLHPPPFPQTLYADLSKKSLSKYIEGVLDFTPTETPTKPKRVRQSLITTTKLINNFYRIMGNGKIDIFEREAGKRHINDLLKEGYSLEDIDFTIEWCFENARNEMEDFSSIKNFIAQALKAREEYLDRRSQKAEEEAEQQEQEEIERKMVEAYRKLMSDSEKDKIRERVIEELRQDKRINQEFVTEQLIVIKENEIIRKELIKL